MNQIPLQTAPRLQTARLILRELRESDAPALYALRRDPERMRYIARPLAQVEEDALNLIRKGLEMQQNAEGLNLAMTFPEDDVLIGTIGYFRPSHEDYRAELGYMMRRDCEGRGLMQEAVEAMIRYGWESLNLHTINASTAPENTASNKLLERNGFRMEGLFRQNCLFEGQFLDTMYWGRIRPADLPPVF